MAPLKSSRVAWSVAFASLALWAASAPQTWGQMTTGAASLLNQSTDQTTITTTSTSILDDTTNNITPTSDDAGPPSVVCPAVPSGVTPLEPIPIPAAPATGAQEGTFHLCSPDASVAHAIEQLIGGRGFSSTLSARGDGCADLTIRASGAANAGGRTSSNLTVSLGSGQNLSIQIVSAGGTTQVSIGQGH
jgi:hypothetical protein